MKKVYTSREFKRLLIDNGYVYKRTTGDHMIYGNGKNTISFNIRNLNRMVARRLIKENNLITKNT